MERRLMGLHEVLGSESLRLKDGGLHADQVRAHWMRKEN